MIHEFIVTQSSMSIIIIIFKNNNTKLTMIKGVKMELELIVISYT